MPTVTDAALVLGLFGHGRHAGGVELDREAANRSFEGIAGVLGLDVEAVARGGLIIATTMMAGAIKTITVERGVDPRQSTLMVFGGAGGLLGTLLATELGLLRIVVPPHPGNFSAWGRLRAEVVTSRARTRLLRLDDQGLEEASEIVSTLFSELEARSELAGVGPGQQEVALDLRYAGQEHTLTVPVAWAGADFVVRASELGAAFTESYEQTFGHTMQEVIELVTLRATVRDSPPVPTVTPPPVAELEAVSREDVRAYSFADEDWREFRVVERNTMDLGAVLAGPAIVVEQTSTTYVDVGFAASGAASGTLVIERVR
jgi:N-methylhydantoinase A